MTVVDRPAPSKSVGNAAPRIAEWLKLPRRRLADPMQWVAAFVIGTPLLLLANSLRTNPALEPGVIIENLFNPVVLQGVVTTVSLAVACLIFGVILGLVIVAMRMSKNPVLSVFASGYIWVLRSVPPLIQILFWYNFGALYPRITIGVPFTDLSLVDVASADVIGSYSSALIALTLIQGAYQAEIFRGGLLAAGFGQREAAMALGMSTFQSMRYVVFPQVLPTILPPTGNQFTHLVKSTAIVSFVALGDILYSVEFLYNQSGKVIPLLIVAMLWYLAILSLAAIGQSRLERAHWR